MRIGLSLLCLSLCANTAFAVGGKESRENYNVWDELELTEDLAVKINRAKTWDLPRKPQDPELAKCGWHSLAQSMTPFYERSRSEYLPVVDGDDGLWEDAKKLRAYVGKDGSTMPWNLTKVAKYWHYEANWGWYLKNPLSLNKIKQKLQQGWGVILTVNGTNRYGMPSRKRIVGGHWVSLEGVVKIKGVDYLIIKDPWPTSFGPKLLKESNLWPYKVFLKATNYRSWVFIR